jgi:hypothetical protein
MTYQLNSAAQKMVDYWSTTREIPFKGELISNDGDGRICMCAQGQVLFHNGYTEKQLFDMFVSEADKETARILGISTIHSRFLRIINDRLEGSPQEVLSDPKKYLGPNWEKVLEFWLYLDGLSQDEKDNITLLYSSLDEDVRLSAMDTARDAAEEVVGLKVRSAARDAPGYFILSCATLELIGNVENKLIYDLFMNR